MTRALRYQEAQQIWPRAFSRLREMTKANLTACNSDVQKKCPIPGHSGRKYVPSAALCNLYWCTCSKPLKTLHTSCRVPELVRKWPKRLMPLAQWACKKSSILFESPLELHSSLPEKYCQQPILLRHLTTQTPSWYHQCTPQSQCVTTSEISYLKTFHCYAFWCNCQSYVTYMANHYCQHVRHFNISKHCSQAQQFPNVSFAAMHCSDVHEEQKCLMVVGHCTGTSEAISLNHRFLFLLFWMCMCTVWEVWDS